ncbi:hypothetical protein C0995_003459 [Termitomyces sp. Mi166|nr:hypothetical protein C0995_003459 [Termitomyces sp. Mi166\
MLVRHPLSRRDALLVLMGVAIWHLWHILDSHQTILDQSIVVGQSTQAIRASPHAPQIVTNTTDIQFDNNTIELSLQEIGNSELPHTSVIAHAPGWTIFRDLYMSNGTLYILSSEQSFPEIRMVISTGLPAFNTPENIAAREPTSQDMDFITPEEARAKWGSKSGLGEHSRVLSVGGNTFLFNDSDQFLGHYYHFVAELFFGAWSFWAGAWSSPTTNAQSAFDLSPPPPPHIDRVIFPHADARGWRDKPGFNAYFLRAAFPSLNVEVRDDWADRVTVTATKHRAWHFPVVLIADRSASFRGSICGGETQRTASEAFESMLNKHQLLGHRVGGWWQPLRKAMWDFAGADLGPVHKDSSTEQSSLSLPEKIVITYISRQGGPRRKLREVDHADLVSALEALVARKGAGWELVVLQAERISKDEQIQAAARTTILLGVHGNGLTHLAFMKPTRASAVVELFYPRGFAHDYHWTARALGMDHYAVWNDTYMTHPNEPRVDYPEGFQGNEIPVDGATVARLIEEHINECAAEA